MTIMNYYDLRKIFYVIIVLLLLSFVRTHLLAFNETNRLDRILIFKTNRERVRRTIYYFRTHTHTHTNKHISIGSIVYNIIIYVRFMVIIILYYALQRNYCRGV